jgi:hypothetical protein
MRSKFARVHNGEVSGYGSRSPGNHTNITVLDERKEHDGNTVGYLARVGRTKSLLCKAPPGAFQYLWPYIKALLSRNRSIFRQV